MSDKAIPPKAKAIDKPPIPQTEIDPERKKLLESLTPQELLYAVKHLKEKMAQSKTQEKKDPVQKEMKEIVKEEKDSVPYQLGKKVIHTTAEETMNAGEILDLVGKYAFASLGFPVKYADFTTKDEVVPESNPNPPNKPNPQMLLLGKYVVDKLITFANNVVTNLLNNPETDKAIANLINKIASMGEEKKA